MKKCVLMVIAFLGLVSGAFAQNIDSQLKDTISAGANIRHSTTNLQTDTVNPKEGADISIDYLWSLSTFLGEPILKCNAAWKLNGVYIKSKPQGSVEWIAAKDIPPKVAASVKIVDLDVKASSMYFKVSFDCDNGVMAAQGKERSWNIPTSPDWHEVFGKGYSKEQAIKENKEKYKAMLNNKNAVATLFEYSVPNVEFNLSGVRDWLAEENKKAAEAEAKLLEKKLAPNPKQAKGKPVKVKPEEVEKRKSAIAEKIAQTEEMRKLSQDEHNGATKTVEAKRSELVEREKELSKPKLIAGRYRDNGDGTITDEVTKLMWQKCPVGTTVNESNTCIGSPTKFTYKDAERQAHSNSFGGHRDWRIPKVSEFLSLAYCSSGNPKEWKSGKDLGINCVEEDKKTVKKTKTSAQEDKKSLAIHPVFPAWKKDDSTFWTSFKRREAVGLSNVYEDAHSTTTIGFRGVGTWYHFDTYTERVLMVRSVSQ